MQRFLSFISPVPSLRAGARRMGRLFRSVPKRTWIGLLIALGLWWVFMFYTRWPAVQGKSEILTVLASGAPNTFTQIVPREDWPYWLSWIPTGINMNDNNAIGMAFAFVIGGAVSSLVLPQRLIKRVLHARGMQGSTLGGLLGAPLMLCSACSVPVALGWQDRGANTETTLGVVMGSALLNMMGLLTIWVMFPSALFWGRLVASLVLVVAATPWAVRLAKWWTRAHGAPTRPASPEATDSDAACAPAALAVRGESWTEAIRGALRAWWDASVEIAYRLFLPMTGATFLAAFLRLFVPPSVVETYLGGGLLAITLTALFGTLIAVPTLFEIPLTMGFLFLGMGPGPATTLVVTAPSVSVVSYFMLRKDTGPRPPLMLMAATFGVGILVGLGVETALAYDG